MNEQEKKLEAFGRLETLKFDGEDFEVRITEGFSGTTQDTTKLMDACCMIAPEYPHVKTMRTKKDFFHLILIKEGRKKPKTEFICGNQDVSTTAEKCSNQCAGCKHRGNNGTV